MSKPNAETFAELLAARQQLAEMRGRWIPFKPGDALPPRGAYLVCTKYNTGRPRDPIGRMETSRHTDDAGAWNDYTVAYWSVPLPPPYDAALAPTSQPSRGKCDEVYRYESCPNEIGENSRGEESCGPDCAQPERHGAERLQSMPNEALADWLEDFIRGECMFRSDEKPAVFREIAKRLRPSPPPTDDIVAGLRMAYDWVRDGSLCVDSPAVSGRELQRKTCEFIDRAIAALGEKGCTRKAVIRECWDAINKYIKPGTLPGNGCDESAQRNGMILASNVLMDMLVKS